MHGFSQNRIIGQTILQTVNHRLKRGDPFLLQGQNPRPSRKAARQFINAIQFWLSQKVRAQIGRGLVQRVKNRCVRA